jgi:hypothetical protein
MTQLLGEPSLGGVPIREEQYHAVAAVFNFRSHADRPQ